MEEPIGPQRSHPASKAIAVLMGAGRGLVRVIWRHREVVAFMSSIITIVGLFLTYLQIMQSNDSYRESVRQFNQSGPQYSWFMLDLSPGLQLGTNLDTASVQTAFAAVVSNTGRTQDTIITMKRETTQPETMTIRLPSFDEQGNLEGDPQVKLNDGTLKLDPGDSRLMVFTTQSENMRTVTEPDGTIRFGSSMFEIGHELTVYSASGKTWTAEWLEPSQEVRNHYLQYPDFDKGMNECRALISQTGKQ